MIKEKPKHIAIIMDGNGRWAKKRFISKILGHRSGAKTLSDIVSYCNEIGIEHITVYAFSTENWKRPKEEVDDIMNLLREYIDEYMKNNVSNNYVVDYIGDLSALDDDLQENICKLIEMSKNNTGIKLHIAINYGGRDEIVRATKKICNDLLNKNLNINNLDESLFSSYLDTNDTPDPELIIRTSGESRVSNFLLWQMAYSELYFTKKLWPDFTKKDVDLAIIKYMDTDRRFGGRNDG